MIFLTERMCAASAHKTGNDKKERSVMAMTTRECYTQMGADYDEVLNRLYSEEMIHRFALLFLKDDSFQNLKTQLAAQNVKEAFRAAHTLKGVCQNPGFGNLYAPACDLTETLRAGKLEGTEEQFAKVEEEYQRTVQAIQAMD